MVVLLTEWPQTKNEKVKHVGNDIDDVTSPLEAGLGWITKFTKDFTNRAHFEKQKTEGVTKKLVGFEMLEKGIARHDYDIKDFKMNDIYPKCELTRI